MGRQMRFHTDYSIHAVAFLRPGCFGPRAMFWMAPVAGATSFRRAIGGRKYRVGEDY